MNFPALPSFYEDPRFQQTQGDLYKLGTDFIGGRIPEYYRSIGETGGPEFQDLIRQNTADISRAGYESAARTGSRGGATASSITKAVSDMTTKLRWADVLRALQGRAGFLNTGVNALTGVRNAGLSFGGQKNQFNLNRYGLEMDQARIQAAEDAKDDSMWSDILSGGLGALGTVAGAFMGGPAGAAVGGSAGGAISSTIFDEGGDYYQPFNFENIFGGGY